MVSSRPRSRGVSTGLVSVFFWRFPVGLGPHCGLVGFWTGAHQMFASLVVPRPRDMFASCFDPNARLSAPFCGDNDWRGQPAVPESGFGCGKPREELAHISKSLGDPSAAAHSAVAGV